MKNRIHRKAERREPLTAIAATIVRGRFVIFALFLLAAVYCVLSLGRVRINSDLTAFLPRDTETRRGIAVMESEFKTYGTARILIEEIPSEEAERVAGQIAGIEHVADVEFDASEEHYKNGNALLSVTFDEEKTGEGARAAMDKIRETLGELPYSFAVQSEVGYDYQNVLAKEMVVVLALSVAVIVAVLLFTSRSYFEVVIFFIVFAFAALLNMGTNFWLGEISAITNSVAVILQLALAIDYAIIFAHRYQDEAERGDDERAALIRALSRSIVEIFSSSLTTVSGLVALTLMRFRLGYDLGIVLSKGILCSMLTVFCLMPGLICLFPRALKKTRHRPFVPGVCGWGRFLSKKVPVFLLLFALILPFSIIFSRRTEYAFANETVTEIIPNAEREEARRFNAIFPSGTAIALLVPAGDPEKEKAVLSAVAELDGVTDATGFINIPAGGGKTLTDPFTPREFSRLVGVEESKATLLYRGYASENRNVAGLIFTANYRVPLLDILYYLFDLIDGGTVELTEEQTAKLTVYRGRIERAAEQLQGENWDRLIVTTSLPIEGEKSVALVEKIRATAEREYEEGSVLAVGDITSARDLSDCYRSDSVLISVLTIVFVFVILLFTFRSPIAAAILVFIIQGSIWINFSMPYLCGSHPSFVTNMIVSAIQMGATIDYAIVMMSRYRARRAEDPPREAMVKALNDAFPTVVTSGTIMAAASLLIAYRVSDVYVGHIGLAVGRGTLISAFLVLTVLPQLLPLTDRAIFLTTVQFFRKNKKYEDRPPEGSQAE